MYGFPHSVYAAIHTKFDSFSPFNSLYSNSKPISATYSNFFSKGKEYSSVHSMASPTVLISISLLVVLVPTTLSQPFTNLPAGPTVLSCGPLLLRLAPCGPFVQGASTSPTERCCSNLRQSYIQQSGCLCLLLNQTGISTLPINTTLALQLPHLCSMHVDSDTCSVSEGLAPRSSTPQVSFGTNSNSTVAASPMVTVPPKTSSILGFGINSSSAVNFNAKESLMIITVLTSWGAFFWL